MRVHKGFTLIELLVVVLIIGILAAIAMAEYTKTVEKSRATEAVASLASIAMAQDREYMRNGSAYATTLNSLDVHVAMKDFNLLMVGETNVVQRKVAAAGGLGQYTITLILPSTPGGGSLTWSCTPVPACTTILPSVK